MASRFGPVIAKKYLAAQIAPLPTMSYALLADKAKNAIVTYELKESNGAPYQLEMLFVWDGKPNAVFMSPSRRSVTDHFIIAPDASFRGE